MNDSCNSFENAKKIATIAEKCRNSAGFWRERKESYNFLGSNFHRNQKKDKCLFGKLEQGKRFKRFASNFIAL